MCALLRIPSHLTCRRSAMWSLSLCDICIRECVRYRCVCARWLAGRYTLACVNMRMVAMAAACPCACSRTRCCAWVFPSCARTCMRSCVCRRARADVHMQRCPRASAYLHICISAYLPICLYVYGYVKVPAHLRLRRHVHVHDAHEHLLANGRCRVRSL